LVSANGRYKAHAGLRVTDIRKPFIPNEPGSRPRDLPPPRRAGR